MYQGLCHKHLVIWSTYELYIAVSHVLEIASMARTSKSGGVFVDPEEVRAAFRFLDVEDKGSVSLKDLRSRLAPFYRDMPLKELRFLMGGQDEVTEADVLSLLEDNDLVFDPVAEAFRVFDPQGKGMADPAVLADVFHRLGFEDLGKEDMEVVMQAADVDGDGKISLADFRDMLGGAGKDPSAAISGSKAAEPSGDAGSGGTASGVATGGEAGQGT